MVVLGRSEMERVASPFPNSVLLQILSRLPVKSLLRFKCASKSCYKLISHPFFQNLHHTRSQRRLRFFLRIGGFDYNLHDNQECRFAYRFASVDSRGITNANFIGNLDNPIKLLLPACYGLVCLGTEKRIYLCNPATCKLFPLPPSPRLLPIAGFGFGYLPSNKAFKVVCFQRSLSSIDCSVFTLPLPRGDCDVPPSGRWRVLNLHSPYLVDQFSYPAFANDTIYWKINHPLHFTNHITLQQARNNNAYVLSMNIKEEKFGVISRPSNWTHSTHRLTQLVELNGKLFLAETCASQVFLWMLTDPQNSVWAQQCCVDLRGIDSTILGEIKCFRKGEIIFTSLANTIFFYDVHKKRFRQVQLPFPAFEFAAYSEALYFPET